MAVLDGGEKKKKNVLSELLAVFETACMRTTNTQISMRICAVWSAFMLFAYCIV